MKIILSGGGTAGHINPAIAIAEEIRKQKPNSKFLFIGREGGRENDAIREAKFPLSTLKLQGLKRKLTIENFKCVSLAYQAKKEAEQIIRAFSPDIIIGTGGYVCWPVLRAGQRLKIPTVIHESNIFAGLTTRMLSGRCDIVLLGNKETASQLKKNTKTCFVGNPLRADFSSVTRIAAREKYKLNNNDVLIVSFGGSIGAEKINDTVIEVMDKFSAPNLKIKHIHATGKRYYDTIRNNKYCSKTDNCHILPYINDMPVLLKAADIVICRCGAMTLSEIATVGVCSILIPSPNVADDHQLKNGKYLAEEGAAILIEESGLTASALIDILEVLTNDKKLREKYAKCIEKFAIKNSEKLIVKEISKIIDENKLKKV